MLGRGVASGFPDGPHGVLQLRAGCFQHLPKQILSVYRVVSRSTGHSLSQPWSYNVVNS